MEKMIAFCGMGCTECPTFLATQENDDSKRKKVAEQWSQFFQMSLKPEDINCDGCHSATGRLFNHCQVCEIRKCGQEKDLKNCAFCNEYPCQKLTNLFMLIPQGKANLEEIRKTL
ncbi:MAG: DUF3795 domain-containing protein [Deltaproteobacteria bacterium]|nr:DUF3795 domain-containing protein [Deltaproteobacteria bacterium]